MEDIFKRNLLSLRNPPPASTFTQALVGNAFWRPGKAHQSAIKAAPAAAPEVYSEKKQVIESLERFAQEKVAEAATPVIKLDGGEMVVRPTPSWSDIPLAGSLSELTGKLSLEQDLLNIVISNKEADKVKVLFVTETFRPYSAVKPELKSGFIDELLAGFPLKTAELFERMIVAMKLAPEEVVIYPIEAGENDLSSEVMALAAFFRPEVIVPLGAKAANRILKGNDRLSLIHGQFFSREVEGAGSFQIVPLFHPSIIETNQNMKKTAWSDMQKIMKQLKKLP